jgi:extradiol dioxygenase family protein
MAKETSNDSRRITSPALPDVGIWPPPPPPPEPQNWVLFDFYIGQKVMTIWGETGTVEECKVGRGGTPMYHVSVSMEVNDWLYFDQIEDDRWVPWCGTPPVFTTD